VQALVSDLVARYGVLDYIFNNAGISVCADARDLEIAHWRKVIDVNLMGVVYGTHAAYQQMVKQGHGHIVNIASLAGLVPFPTNAPYAASKHAVVGLSLSMRTEGEALGVKVSAVCPGFSVSGASRQARRSRPAEPGVAYCGSWSRRRGSRILTSMDFM
jgi:NAD(P)-dependent dehydrogenase (short-subunit alcohol dehydrogenase family)